MFLVDFVNWSPLFSILIFSLIITFLLSLLYKILIDQKKFKELKEKQKELQEKIKQTKETEKLAELQKELMRTSLESMKLTMKPTLITLFPLLLIFAGLKWLYTSATNVGNIISWPWNLPLIGNGAGWLLCYIIFGFIFSLIIRKILKIN